MPDGALELARDVAARTADVIRSAAEFAQQQAAIIALYEVALPLSPPAVDGLDIGACYVPYTHGGTFGGDWWEALPLRDGRVGLAVGDVAGHGLPAAAIMGQLRNAQRTCLIAGASPSEVLTELSALLDWTHPDAHASSLVAILDPVTGTIEWASAGHPPAVWVTGREAGLLDAPPGPPLGVVARAGAGYTDHGGEVAPGGFLLMYTDGLLESRSLSARCGPGRTEGRGAEPPRRDDSARM